MERVRSSAGDGERTERFEAHTLESYPPALHKKVTLLQHFRDYLVQQQRDKAEKDAAEGRPAAEAAAGGPGAVRSAWGEPGADGASGLVFVKKWVRTRHAILFRLSNHTVQVMFLDNTEVVLSAEARVLTFCDKQVRVALERFQSALFFRALVGLPRHSACRGRGPRSVEAGAQSISSPFRRVPSAPRSMAASYRPPPPPPGFKPWFSPRAPGGPCLSPRWPSRRGPTSRSGSSTPRTF